MLWRGSGDSDPGAQFAIRSSSVRSMFNFSCTGGRCTPSTLMKNKLAKSSVCASKWIRPITVREKTSPYPTTPGTSARV